jgi:hypothetical protein
MYSKQLGDITLIYGREESRKGFKSKLKYLPLKLI